MTCQSLRTALSKSVRSGPDAPDHSLHPANRYNLPFQLNPTSRSFFLCSLSQQYRSSGEERSVTEYLSFYSR
jgi:hypothetical protein